MALHGFCMVRVNLNNVYGTNGKPAAILTARVSGDTALALAIRRGCRQMGSYILLGCLDIVESSGHPKNLSGKGQAQRRCQQLVAAHTKIHMYYSFRVLQRRVATTSRPGGSSLGVRSAKGRREPNGAKPAQRRVVRNPLRLLSFPLSSQLQTRGPSSLFGPGCLHGTCRKRRYGS